MANVININNIANTYLERSEVYNAYMENIRKIPLLDRDVERRLLIKYSTSKDEQEKIKIRNTLLKHNQRFVVAAAKLYANNKVDLFLDLLSEANLGFIEAIEAYNCEKSTIRLLSWAAFYMRRSMNIYLIKHKNLVRQSYDMLMYSQLTKAKTKLLQELQREPSEEEIVNFLAQTKNLTIKDPKDLLQVQVNSIDAPIDEEQFNKSIYDYNAVTATSNSSETTIEKHDNKKILQIAMNALSDKEKKIFSMLYGLDGQFSEATIERVAEEFNCTSERIRQIHNKGLVKMATKLKESVELSY